MKSMQAEVQNYNAGKNIYNKNLLILIKLVHF